MLYNIIFFVIVVKLRSKKDRRGIWCEFVFFFIIYFKVNKYYLK